MQRRSLITGLAGILATGFAPAAVGAEVLMPVKRLVTPPLQARHLLMTGPVYLRNYDIVRSTQFKGLLEVRYKDTGNLRGLYTTVRCFDGPNLIKFEDRYATT